MYNEWLLWKQVEIITNTIQILSLIDLDETMWKFAWASCWQSRCFCTMNIWRLTCHTYHIFSFLVENKTCTDRESLSMQVLFTNHLKTFVQKCSYPAVITYDHEPSSIVIVEKAISIVIRLIIFLMQRDESEILWKEIARWWVPSRAYRDPPLDTLPYITLHCSARYTTLQCTLH